jgi:hypothetical protein
MTIFVSVTTSRTLSAAVGLSIIQHGLRGGVAQFKSAIGRTRCGELCADSFCGRPKIETLSPKHGTAMLAVSYADVDSSFLY